MPSRSATGSGPVAAPPTDAGERVVQGVEALNDIILVSKRAIWQLAIFPHTYREILATRDGNRHRQLERWCGEVWQYWLDIIHQNDDLPSFIVQSGLASHCSSPAPLPPCGTSWIKYSCR